MQFLPKSARVAIEMWPIWTFLSHQDLRSQFRRSKLGVLWLVANQLVFAIGGGYLWAALFGLDPKTFIPFIALGFAIWGYMTSSIVDGCATFVIASGYIRQVPLPLEIYIARITYTAIIRLGIGLGVAISLGVLLGAIRIPGLFFALPGLALLLTLGLLSTAVLAYVGVVYRDLQHGFSNIFQMLFVVTPIIYPPEILVAKGLGWLVYLNPFAAPIEIVRAPLLTGAPAGAAYYALCAAFAVVLALLFSVVRRTFERRVVYYV